ncbi:MAG: hypothetical protein JWO53_370, partial [Chlamydiia bacterium]|nr:hypothetical protein [Chlamydiia bacterium]
MDQTLQWKRIVEEQITKNSNKVCAVTKPLHDHFGVSYFTYHRIDLEGRYTVLLDRPDWAEHYVSKKFYLIDPYLRHPDVYETGTCFVESHGTEEYKRTLLRDGSKLFDLTHGVLLIEKSADAVEFFGFSGNQTTGNFHKLYLNHLPLLQTFARHFKQEMRSILY